ncbi:MAG: hypothetical protein Q9190_000772 [Brigantiaea leucoxantha]
MKWAKNSADAARKENQYIPSFISKKPFYLDSADTDDDYLEHQRLQTDAQHQSKWYDRGKRLGPAATKFRKGACENCGAMTHKTKECLSRPRAKGAKWTGKDIQADEMVQDVELGWDAKRDRWNGYDSVEYRKVVEEYEELEDLKKKLRGDNSENAQQKTLASDSNDGSPQEQQEAKSAEESDMGGQQSTATRYIRQREDTAKYLLNLDSDSAKYDPKTRLMADMGAQTDQAAALVAEDNFTRASGDAAEFQKALKYAWESQERGDKNGTHFQANPTSGEYFRRKEEQEQIAKREARQKSLLEKYGGGQYLQPASFKGAAVTENEVYVEYDDTGAIKGAPKATAKSKYPEDIMVNNHTSVWGSWWKDFRWGYACCHSTVKNSYCTGEAGKLAFEEANRMETGEEIDGISSPQTNDRTSLASKNHNSVKDPSSNPAAKAQSDIEDMAKKRTLAEMKGEATEEEVEAYKRSRAIANDPMANFLGTR